VTTIERQHLLARAVIMRSDEQGYSVLLAQQIGESHTFLPGGHGREYWWLKLQHLTSAYRDWD
jgi:hypothetical protein